MQITKNFNMSEFTRTSHSPLPLQPGVSQQQNLKDLCHYVLQPARDQLGLPIRITSGYRSPEVNLAVGGVPNSQHLRGEAADITAGSAASNLRLYQILRQLPFDQLIVYGNYRFLHVSFRRDKNRQQVLRY